MFSCIYSLINFIQLLNFILKALSAEPGYVLFADAPLKGRLADMG